MSEHCTLHLAVEEVDLSAFDSLMEQIQARGVTFSSLAEEQAESADWLARFCDLDNETRRGDGGAPRTVAQMPDRLAFLGVVPDALLLAKLGEVYIGYTLLNIDEADPMRLRQGWTGVRPEHQRQGIGTALKVLGIAYAKRHGYQSIVTEPRVSNTASLRMSQKVGFHCREISSI